MEELGAWWWWLWLDGEDEFYEFLFDVYSIHSQIVVSCGIIRVLLSWTEKTSLPLSGEEGCVLVVMHDACNLMLFVVCWVSNVLPV